MRLGIEKKKKADETEGEKEFKDEKKVTVASAQQMLLLKRSVVNRYGVC